MDLDLEQEYGRIVNTMKEQIVLLKAKLKNKRGQSYRAQVGDEELERKDITIQTLNLEIQHYSSELLSLREAQRELASDLQSYHSQQDSSTCLPNREETRAFQEIDQLTSLLNDAKREYSETLAKQHAQTPSPASNRINFITRKYAAVCNEHAELTERLSAAENDRKTISENYTSLVDRLKSEDKLKQKIRRLEQIYGEKELELEAKTTELKAILSKLGGIDYSQMLTQLQAQIDQEREMIGETQDLISRFQHQLRNLELESSPLENSASIQKLRGELKQSELTLQGKVKMLRMKDQELDNFKAQRDQLNAELQFLIATAEVRTTPKSVQLDLSKLTKDVSSLKIDSAYSNRTPMTRTPTKAFSSAELLKESKSAGRLGTKLATERLNSSMTVKRRGIIRRTEHTRSTANSPYPVTESYARMHANKARLG